MSLSHQEAKSYMHLLMSPTVTQQSFLPVIDQQSHLCSDSAMKLIMSMMIPMVIGLTYYYLSCCKPWAMQSPNVGSQKATNQAGE
jgi:undecaprenyl pyrophosphate phosphatase UppP